LIAFIGLASNLSCSVGDRTGTEANAPKEAVASETDASAEVATDESNADTADNQAQYEEWMPRFCWPPSCKPPKPFQGYPFGTLLTIKAIRTEKGYWTENSKSKEPIGFYDVIEIEGQPVNCYLTQGRIEVDFSDLREGHWPAGTEILFRA